MFVARLIIIYLNKSQPLLIRPLLRHSAARGLYLSILLPFIWTSGVVADGFRAAGLVGGL